MNPYEMMKFHQKEFNKTDQKIYDSILEDPQSAITFSIVKSAQCMGVSKDALLRFCKKLGYEGFKEFRFELARYVHAGENEQTATTKSQKREQVIQIYNKGLQDLLTCIHDQDYVELNEMMLQASRIRIFAVHRTGLIANELNYRLMKIGVDSDAYTDTIFFRSITELAIAQELHIYISMSSTSKEIIENVEISKKIGAKTLLITQNSRPPRDELYDKVITLPTLEFPHTEFFLDATMLCYPFIEMIVMSLSSYMIDHKKNLIGLK